MRLIGPALLVFVVTACGNEKSLFVKRVWPSDEPAVLIVTTPEGATVSPTPVIVDPDETRQLDVDAPEVIVYARTFAELSEQSLTGCVIGAGSSDGTLLGDPTRAWRSKVSTGGSIVLETEADPVGFELRIDGCLPSCEVEAEPVELGATHEDLSAVVAVNEETFLASGTFVSSEDDRSVRIRFERGTRTDLSLIDGVVGHSSLTRRGHQVVGGAAFTYYTADLAGSLIRTATLAHRILAIDSGEDGTVVLLGPRGDLSIIEPWSDEAVPFSGPQYEDVTPRDHPAVWVHSRELIALGGPDRSVHLWRAGSWERLIEPMERAVEAIHVDPDYLLVMIDKGSDLLLRLPDGDFSGIGTKLMFSNIDAVIGLGEARYLAVGQNGRYIFYNSRDWCDLMSASERNLDDVDVAPGGRVAFAVGENETPGDPPTAVRFTFP